MAAAANFDLTTGEVAAVHLHTKFGEDILKGGRVMTIYVFFKWRPAAILDFVNRFLALDSMLSALYAIARPSVCPSHVVQNDSFFNINT